MRSRIVLFRLIVLTMLLLFTLPVVLSAQEALTQTFTSADGTLTMSYPDGWTATEEDGLIRFNGDQAFLQVNYRDYEGQVTPLELLEISGSVDYGFSEPEELVVAGYAALVARDMLMGAQWQIVLDFCDGILGKAIGFVQGDLASFEPTFLAMVDSIRFTGGGSQSCGGVSEGSSESAASLYGLQPITPANAVAVVQLTTLGDADVAVESVAFSMEGNFFAVGDADGTVQVWNLVTNEEVATLTGHRDGATSVAFDPGGYNMATGAGNGQVRLWDAATGDASGTLQEHEAAVQSVAMGGEYGFLIASGADDGSVRLWDVSNAAETPLTDNVLGGAVSGVAFTPDGTILAAGGGNTIRLWDTATGAVLTSLETEIGDISSVSFVADSGFLLYGGADAAVWVWDLEDETLPVFGEIAPPLSALALSPDGAMIATADAGGVRLWDVATAASLVTLASSSGEGVNSIAFNADGSLLASGGDTGGVALWATSEAGDESSSETVSTSEETGETAEMVMTEEATTSATTCTITAPNNANLRSGPGTNFDRAGSLSAGQTAEVDGQTVGADGMTWYRLTDGTWARSDVVSAPAECANVPVVTT